MPENKLENFVFTLIMAFLMVYAMICYNIALNVGGMKDTVFLMAFHELIIMWPVAIVLEMFIMEKPVMALTSRVVTEDMPFFFMLLTRCALTVCLMCPAMSLIATFLFKEYREAFLPVLPVDGFSEHCSEENALCIQKKTRSEIKEAAPLWQKMFINRVCRI